MLVPDSPKCYHGLNDLPQPRRTGILMAFVVVTCAIHRLLAQGYCKIGSRNVSCVVFGACSWLPHQDLNAMLASLSLHCYK